mgnify:CR=1 FL=1
MNEIILYQCNGNISDFKHPQVNNKDEILNDNGEVFYMSTDPLKYKINKELHIGEKIYLDDNYGKITERQYNINNDSFTYIGYIIKNKRASC